MVAYIDDFHPDDDGIARVYPAGAAVAPAQGTRSSSAGFRGLGGAGRKTQKLSTLLRRRDPSPDLFDRLRLDAEIAVRRLSPAGLPFHCRTVEVEDFFARRLNERLGDFRRAARRARRAGIAVVRDDRDRNRNPTAPGSLSKRRVRPGAAAAGYRRHHHDTRRFCAPRRAAPPTAAMVP